MQVDEEAVVIQLLQAVVDEAGRKGVASQVT